MSIEGSSGMPATAMEASVPETQAIVPETQAMATPQPAVAKEAITPRDLSRARKQAKQIEQLNGRVAELTNSLNRVENQQAESAMHTEAHWTEISSQIAQLQTQVAQLQARPKSKPKTKPAKKGIAAKSAKKKKKKAARKKR